jgi:hypothetical protein
MYRIYAFADGDWFEVFKNRSVYVVASAWQAAVRYPFSLDELVATLTLGRAVEATDPTGVRGLICADDCPDRPARGVLA